MSPCSDPQVVEVLSHELDAMAMQVDIEHPRSDSISAQTPQKQYTNPFLIIYAEFPVHEGIFKYLPIVDIVRFGSTCSKAREVYLGYLSRHYDIYNHLSYFFPPSHRRLPYKPAMQDDDTTNDAFNHANDAEKQVKEEELEDSESIISSLRLLQATTGALISGSNALQFFLSTCWPKSDLDIYVHHNHVKQLGRFFATHGYTFESRNEDQPSDFEEAVDSYDGGMTDKLLNLDDTTDDIYRNSTLQPFVVDLINLDDISEYRAMRGVSDVFNFLMQVKEDDGEIKTRKIQVIAAKYTPLEVILYFHSTVVMNIISHHSAYCLYPILTLRDHRSLICRSAGPRQGTARAKYEERGWKMIDWHNCTLYPGLTGVRPPSKRWVHADRWVGNPYTFTIPLGPIRNASKVFSSPTLKGSGIELERILSSNAAMTTLTMASGPVPDFPPRDFLRLNGWTLRITNSSRVEARALVSKNISSVYLFPLRRKWPRPGRGDVAILVHSLCEHAGDVRNVEGTIYEIWRRAQLENEEIDSYMHRLLEYDYARITWY